MAGRCRSRIVWRMDITIESMRSGDERQRYDLRRQAFGGTYSFDPDLEDPSPDRIVSAYAGDTLVGTVVTLDFAMTWAGAPVRCGGISGVVVRPETRGLGIARRLLHETFDRMLSRGEVTAALFPTTAPLYRSVGFEIAGSYEWRRLELGLLPAEPARALTWRRVDFDDRAIRAVHEQMSMSTDGWMVQDDAWWSRWARMMSGDPSKNRYAYIGRRAGDDVSVLVYRYDSSSSRMYDLVVESVAGVDGAALGAALGFLATNGTTAGEVETTLAGSTLALHVPNAQFARVTNAAPWMLRLVSVSGAFEQRRWPSVVAGSVDLIVSDDTVEANAGPWVLSFVDGAASMTPGGSGRIAVEVGDLAHIYAGGDVGALARAGRMPGADRADVDLLTAACASHPTMPFFF